MVLNKFLQIEGRINTLMELIPQLEIQTEELSGESQKLYADIMANLKTVEDAE